MIRYAAPVAFLLCIPAANWLIGHVGTVCSAQGPCLIPVAPGLMAPSGVLMIGLALVLRDLVHRWFGLGWVLASITVGAMLSAYIAPPTLVIASTFAFLLSELADTAVYAPLAQSRFLFAVMLSSLVGLVIDSIVFLWLAFGSLSFLPGQVVGKAIMVALALPVIWLLKRREAMA